MPRRCSPSWRFIDSDSTRPFKVQGFNVFDLIWDWFRTLNIAGKPEQQKTAGILLPSFCCIRVFYLTVSPTIKTIIAIIPAGAAAIGVVSAKDTIGVTCDLLPESWPAPEKAREVAALVHVSSVVDQVWICSQLGRNTRMIPQKQMKIPNIVAETAPGCSGCAQYRKRESQHHREKENGFRTIKRFHVNTSSAGLDEWVGGLLNT
jgi:hypothetical protein